jgi:hypothetical protein
MTSARKLLLTIAVTFGPLLTGPAQAQTTSEERFQDVFITAGYATAFGAALGAASLSFFENPTQHLKLIAIGASLGFIGGTILGSYVVLAPAIAADGDLMNSTLLAEGVVPEKGIALRPTFDSASHKLAQVEGAFTILSF